MYTDSPHLKSTMSNEEYEAEYRRWNSLTREAQIKERDMILDAYRKKEQERRIIKEKELKERSLRGAERDYIYTDKVNTMENSEATIIWIAVMIIGTIFVDRLTIWIVATVIWWRFIKRYKIRKKKWNTVGKKEYEEKMKNGGK